MLVLYVHFAITRVTTNLNEDHHCMLNPLVKKMDGRAFYSLSVKVSFTNYLLIAKGNNRPLQWRKLAGTNFTN